MKAVKIQKDSSPIYAILALIGGFLFGILGIPFGIAGLKIYKRKMERNFCWTGIILGAIWIVADIVMTIVYASLLL